MKHLHTFTHEAMKTTFTLHLVSTHTERAKNAALACIGKIDEIEERLSRYVLGSDVWQINHMQSNQSIFVSEDCYDCLLLALKAHQATNGLFDITLGRLIEHVKQREHGERPQVTGQLMVDPERPAVHCIERGREVDFGGIGKGFALDRIVATCKDWKIESGLLSAGASTQIAFGEKPWKITLQGDQFTKVIEINNQALSASGTAIQGSHIVSPVNADSACPRASAWVIDDSAAMADALSTAALLTQDLDQLQSLNQSARFFTENDQGIFDITLKQEPDQS